jgi:phage baseplate assembly protein gpV
MNKNFAGLNGFIWWIGVIENRVDPLTLGRCQVRIFGWHNENSVTLPTSDLPWAQAMIPINDSKHFSVPRVGEWVVGFFMDGEQAQTPVMMGVLPGLKP